MESISVMRGIDPRKYLCIVAGGAGATHAGRLAETLEMKKILVPHRAGELCAMGMLISDIKYEYVQAFFTTSDDFDLDRVKQIYHDMEKQATIELQDEGVSRENIQFKRWVEARYYMQIWEITVPVPIGELNKHDITTITNNFHEAHKELYTYSRLQQPVEFITWRLSAIGSVPRVSLKEQTLYSEDPAAAIKGERMVYFDEEKSRIKTPIYDGTKLVFGNILQGPAVIEIPTTTVVVFPKWQVTVTRNSDYLMEYIN